jgi:hypothetical protein
MEKKTRTKKIVKMASVNLLILFFKRLANISSLDYSATILIIQCNKCLK